MRRIYMLILILSLTFYGCMQVVSSNKNEPPRAKFSISPKTGTTGTDFIFDGSFSSDDKDNVEELGYFWEYFSPYGRRIDSAYGMRDTATFSDTGQFVISLSVFDLDSLTGQTEDTIQVLPHKKPALSVIDTTINFGPVEIDYTITKRIKITNPGLDTLKVQAVYFTGTGKAAFSSDFEQQINLLPDSTDMIAVHFSPHETGDFVSEININTNDPDIPNKKIEIRGQAFADLYDLELTNLPADTIDFAELMVDEQATFDLTIKNTGDESRKLLAAYITGAGKNAFDVDFTSDFMIPAGSERSLTITFEPEDTVAYSATLVIKSDDTFSKTKEITLLGKGYKDFPILELSNIAAETLDFGEVGVSKTENFMLIITNRGKADLEISAIYITGGDRDFFGNDFDDKFILAPAEKKIITIDFTPGDDIPYNATLNIHSNDENISLQEINLKGKGVLSKLEIVSPVKGEIEFEEVALGRDSTIYVEVRNSGKGDLMLLDAYIALENRSAFRCDFDGEVLLESGDNELIGITFSPAEAFDYTAEFVLKTDELVDNRKVLPVTGTGHQDLALVMEQDSLLFGNVPVNTDSTKSIRVENRGEETLKIYYAYFTGPDINYFSSDFNAEKVIAAGEEAVIDITFSPTDAKPLDNNYFCFFTDAPGQSLQKIYIDGQGIFPPEISCADTIDFEDVPLHQSKTMVLTIENSGKSQIVNLNLSLDSDDFSFDVVQPIDLMPGVSLDADIIFHPVNSIGTKNATLSISSEHWGIIRQVHLKGIAK